MSYCRWSSDNWKCDIYAYESCNGGYEIHIAGRKRVGKVPEVDYNLLRDDKIREFKKQYNKQMRWLKKAKLKPIGLKYDGKSFHADTLEEFRDTMIMLRNEGYNFPDYVFEDIKVELDQL
jgi:hypothetical protein